MWSHGNFYWNELNTRDAGAAKAFYGALVGWTFDEMRMAEGTYWVAMQDGKPAAGIFTMSELEFEGVPEHWFTYLAVDDVDTRVERVSAAGGQVIRPPFDVPGVGRIAIVKDPMGAALGIMTPAPMPV